MPVRSTWLGALALAVACAAPGQTGGGAAMAPPGKTMVPYSDLTAAPAPPADHREAYGTGAPQFGELRLPPRPNGRVPVVVLLHGGCWRAAFDLGHVASAAEGIASAGYAVWVPEYRRVGDDGGGWPGTFDDVANAIDHVRALAARHPALDTARVVLVGHSAGGQLALWAASRRPVDATAGRDSPGALTPGRSPLAVAGVVSLAAITDLAEYGATPRGCNSAVTPLMGGTAAQVPDRYRAVSPLERVPIGVPVRIVHGADDPIVPVAQSRAFVAASKRASASVTLVEVAGAGHFDLVSTQSTSWPAVLDAIRALARPTRR